MYYYWAFGLNIHAEIPFPELYEVAAFDEPDAILSLGKVPLTIHGELGFRSESIMISPKEYLLHVKDVASYYVQEGKSIVIEKNEESDWDSVRLFCLSNAFAALLQQRNLIPLHCSAFLDKDELVLIMGDSGAGKSTTLAGMINRGYQPFSDDVCVSFFKEGSNELFMCSSYPMMKYWGDTFEKVDIRGGIKDRKIRPDMDKFGVYFHERFMTGIKKVKLVVLIEKDATIEFVSVKKISGIDLFQRLERNAYRGEYLGFAGLKKEHFKLFTAIANSTKTVLVSRPSNENSIEELLNLISGEMQEKEF
jgi:energy-coupling factor transporter ATP-binding protein EcfA2